MAVIQLRDIIILIRKTRIDIFFALAILFFLFIYLIQIGMVFYLLRTSFISVAIIIFLELHKTNKISISKNPIYVQHKVKK
ncbi:MAG: hypothetical protein CMG75_09910 [Candidatus Marinimicrobia bacterium]|nr:hypothetical protein [Candidatus Neomarinimicrobiota bacterium]